MREGIPALYASQPPFVGVYPPALVPVPGTNTVYRQGWGCPFYTFGRGFSEARIDLKKGVKRVISGHY